MSAWLSSGPVAIARAFAHHSARGLHKLGIFYMDLDVQNVNPPPPQTITFTRGMKLCEMRSIRGGQKKIKMFTATTNHLGNVLATISDRKQQHSGDGTSVDYYTADVRSARHYYPFGMIMPGIPGRESAPAELQTEDSLVVENHFVSGTEGWGPYNGSSTVVNDNGRLKVSASIVWGTVRKDVTLIPGRYYRLRITIDKDNFTDVRGIVANPADGTYVKFPEIGSSSIPSSGDYVCTFTAVADSLLLQFSAPTLPPGADTGYFWLSDVRVDEIIEYEGGGSGSGSGGYRYGFNGKELDKETSSTTTYNYGFRIYSPALGRFLSVDPLTKTYPELTPYQFASNRPIDGIDLDGLEYISFHHYANGAVAKTEFYKMTDKDIKRLGGTTAGIHNSVPYGPDGKGIVHYYYDDAGNKIDKRTQWEQRQTDIKSDLTFHGLYSGPGSITHDGKPKSTNYDFNEQPIDWADAIAKRHDMDYAKTAPIGYAGYLEDIRTVQADRDMVKRIDNIVAKNIPFTNWEGVEGIETPVRTSYSTEMDFSLLGQRALINSLATYKQWKMDNNYLDISKDSKQTFNNLKGEFYKAHPSAAAVLDLIPKDKD